MEVASPLTYVKAGTKRRFACSPMMDEMGDDTTTTSSSSVVVSNPTTNVTPFASIPPSSPFDHAFKRRRFENNENVPNHNGFNGFTHSGGNGVIPFSGIASVACKGSLKRQRHDEPEIPHSPPPTKHQLQQLQTTLQNQQTQIETLTTEKTKLQQTLTQIQSTNEQLSSQNKILRNGIRIQQERQGSIVNELEAARVYKVEAEDKMKRYEGMISQLRYHLQAQGSACQENHFFMPRPPPDVF